MIKIKLPFTITNQNLRPVPSDVVLRAGNKNYFYTTIECSSEWSEIEPLYGVFKRDNLVIQQELIKDDCNYECRIPNEMMEETGIFTFGVTGGDALITNEVYVWVELSCGRADGSCDDTPSDPSDPSETVAILGTATLGLLVLGNGE